MTTPAPTVTLGLVLACAACGCSGPSEPAASNAFATVEVRRIDDGAPLDAVVRLSRNSGMRVEFRLFPKADRPEDLGERPVQPTDDWELACLYDVSSLYGKGRIVGAQVQRFALPAEAPRPSRSIRGRPRWREAGFTKEPAAPTDMAPGELRFWTYLTDPTGAAPGELPYQIVLWPAVKPSTSPLKPALGKPVVLWRGRLLIDPQPEGPARPATSP